MILGTMIYNNFNILKNDEAVSNTLETH